MAAATNGASSSSPPGFNPGQSPNYSFVPPSTPSPYLQAFFAYVDAMHAWDFDRVMQCFDESLEHRILPKSLGRPVLNKRQYGEYFKGTMPLFVKFRVSAASSVYQTVELINRMTVYFLRLFSKLFSSGYSDCLRTDALVFSPDPRCHLPITSLSLAIWLRHPFPPFHITIS
jgi:hypothetical protein